MGVTWANELDAFNLALYSHHATGVTVEAFSVDRPEDPVHRVVLDPRRNKTGRVWHCLLSAADLRDATVYGLRVEGPWDPGRGHRFDPSKLLVDPYATEIWFPPGFDREAARQPGDNTGKAPLGVLRRNVRLDGPRVPRPSPHTHDAVIYELHVRGFTASLTSDVTPTKRGTFAGLIEKIPYLVDLGVTIVELMPVQQFDPQEGSCWGYMTLGFFAPHRDYAASSDPVKEFRDLVSAFHTAGIEVLLDVVYNHTAEGAADGPTYNLRGIDNTSYYLLESGDLERYVDDAGCGNVIRAGHDAARRLVVDSVRYWSGEFGVDGFRFDLASVLARDADGSIRQAHAPLISQLSDEASRDDLRLVAEAWDLRTYLLGKTFPGYSWAQWNGEFRDDARSFARGDEGFVGAMMRRLYGSDDLFPDTVRDAYRPDQSINYVTCHDGFTLHDLVTYEHKRNHPNGHWGRDGPEDNRSWNCGWEGEGAPADVERLRQRQMRNFAALLMLANGTPMVRAGDEFGQTQRGNNNPYNQDNDTSWLNWSLLTRNRGLHRFWKLVIEFRKAHPSIARGRFWRDAVQWLGTDGQVDVTPSSKAFAYHLDGTDEADDDLYVMVNASPVPIVFEIQVTARREWLRVLDSARPSPEDISEPGREQAVRTSNLELAARSVVVLRQKRPAAPDVVARPRSVSVNSGLEGSLHLSATPPSLHGHDEFTRLRSTGAVDSPTNAALAVRSLGPGRFESSLAAGTGFVDARRVLVSALIGDETIPPPMPDAPSFEIAGPRETLFFDPTSATIGIVTCGGLCPGLNNVIRSVVMTADRRYGVRRVIGFRHGFEGIVDRDLIPMDLRPDTVDDIHRHGGTLLGTSRGPQDVAVMLDRLIELKVDALVCVGGDGTMRGMEALAREAACRRIPISLVAAPKTIDNDLPWVERSFGFATAVEEAGRSITAAHAEARGARNGIGVVKLMGRHSGSIAAHASLAFPDVNFCLVPEVGFDPPVLCDAVAERLRQRGHAVIVVAEGTAQEQIVAPEHSLGSDASGNPRLADVGPWLCDVLTQRLNEAGVATIIRYLDPSYAIRSRPANATDAEFCSALGQHAVHAALAGRTATVIGYWNQHFTHVPVEAVTSHRRRLDPAGDAWQRVLEATGQPTLYR